VAVAVAVRRLAVAVGQTEEGRMSLLTAYTADPLGQPAPSAVVGAASRV